MIKIINDCWIESEEMGEVPYLLSEIVDYFSPNISRTNYLYSKNYKLPPSLQFLDDLYESLVDEGLEETYCDIDIRYEGEGDDLEQIPEKEYIHFCFSSFTVSYIQEYNSDNYYWILRIKSDDSNKEGFARAKDFSSDGFAEPINFPYFYDLDNKILTVKSRDYWTEDEGWHQAVRIL
ncbi:MAG: hypothetical protein AB4057_00345 [Crocosphaera sp.]